MANRHGLIAGATGTGKTRTLRCRRQFSRPRAVFLADLKGDLWASRCGSEQRQIEGARRPPASRGSGQPVEYLS